MQYMCNLNAYAILLIIDLSNMLAFMPLCRIGVICHNWPFKIN